MGDVRVKLRVTGWVQGVMYRASAREAARRLGLAGWVRNEADGSVTGVAEGDEESIAAFVAWCRRGPTGARVENVETTFGPATGEYGDFSVRH